MCVQFYHKYEANYEEHEVKINFFTGKGSENVVNIMNRISSVFPSKSNQVTWEAAKLFPSTTAAAVTTKTAPVSANKYLVTVAWTIMSYDWLVESGIRYESPRPHFLTSTRTNYELWSTAVDPAE